MSRPPLLTRFHDDLLAYFGRQHWWPADSPWEVAVGAVLTQNTNWLNVERAIARLKTADMLDPERLAALPETELAELIRPAGTFRVKAARLHHLAAWWIAQAAAAADPAIDWRTLRASLLAVHGIGPETADSILLYAFGRPTFVIDAYTRRILGRHGLVAPHAPYADLQATCTAQLPAEASVYNETHALLVVLAKLHCRPTPRCADCPLRWHLARLPHGQPMPV